MEGVAAAWDAISDVRTRVREGHDLIREVSDKNQDLKTASTYGDILKPILQRMRDHPDTKLPNIDRLREEVTSFLQGCKKEPQETDVHRFSWLIRKNVGFVKLKCRRLEVSTASQLMLL